MTASWVDEAWLAIDTETTGVDVFADRVVEVAAVKVLPDGTAGETWTTIVNPGVEIPEDASAIHHITTARAIAEGVAPAAALERLAEIIFSHGHRPVVMFNAVFDWPILLSEAERHAVEFPVFAPVLDPYLIDRMMDERRRGKRKLGLVAQHYGVDFDEADAHGALADAIAAARVMRKIVERYPQVGERSLASVYLRQVRGHERWRDGFVDWKRRQGDHAFDIPPGWPIPALTKGGLPVLEPVVGAGPTGAESAGNPPPPAPASPPATPAPARGITKVDVAKLAAKAFEAAGNAAPPRTKTKTVERLRHALVYACTHGRTWSLNDLTGDELASIARNLVWITDGTITFDHDDQRVVFTQASSGDKRAVEWAQLENQPAA